MKQVVSENRPGEWHSWWVLFQLLIYSTAGYCFLLTTQKQQIWREWVFGGWHTCSNKSWGKAMVKCPLVSEAFSVYSSRAVSPTPELLVPHRLTLPQTSSPISASLHLSPHCWWLFTSSVGSRLQRSWGLAVPSLTAIDIRWMSVWVNVCEEKMPVKV